MRRELVFVVLVFLYISPVILSPSYTSLAIPEQQNYTIAEGEYWLTGWTYRKAVYLNGTAGAGTNYTTLITVPYDSNMESDYDDIRFTDNDGNTLLSHWRETYNATYALFWVQVTDNLDSDVTIYMYYGYSSATDVSDGSIFLVFEDWSTESIRSAVWDNQTMDGNPTFTTSGASHGAICTFGPSNSQQKITSDYDACSPLAVRFFSKLKECAVGDTVRQGSGWDGAFGFSLVQSTGASGEKLYVYDDDGNQDSQALSSDYFDSWQTWEVRRYEGGAENKTSVLVNDTLLAIASFQPDAVSTNPAASIMAGGTGSEIKSDWVLVRAYVYDEPSLHSFGTEEVTGYDWELIGSAELVFIVSLDTWAMDMFLILLGLVFVPLSLVLAAYFIRTKSGSSNKLLYVILLFLMGWGLLIGGII